MPQIHIDTYFQAWCIAFVAVYNAFKQICWLHLKQLLDSHSFHSEQTCVITWASEAHRCKVEDKQSQYPGRNDTIYIGSNQLHDTSLYSFSFVLGHIKGAWATVALVPVSLLFQRESLRPRCSPLWISPLLRRKAEAEVLYSSVVLVN